jgi:NADPH:quinone reductase
MKAVQVAEYGSSRVLATVELPVPKHQPGQLLIKLEAVGMNFIDIKMRSGDYPRELPFVPGIEGAGTIAAGADTVGLEEGAQVVSPNLLGAYAEYALVDATRVVPIPVGVSSALAAAAIVHGLTAHYLTHSIFPLEKGDSCLVHAAAGGVGLMIVQLAKRRGARVIGTVSTSEKANLALSAGADDVIVSSDAGFESELKRLAPDGVRIVYDAIGQATALDSLRCISRRGCLVCFGEASGPVEPIPPRLLAEAGSVFLTRCNLADYTRTREELLWRAEEVLGWVASGELKVHIHARLPLDAAGRAHEMVETRKSMGKIILLPVEETVG